MPGARPDCWTGDRRDGQRGENEPSLWPNTRSSRMFQQIAISDADDAAESAPFLGACMTLAYEQARGSGANVRKFGERHGCRPVAVHG